MNIRLAVTTLLAALAGAQDPAQQPAPISQQKDSPATPAPQARHAPLPQGLDLGSTLPEDLTLQDLEGDPHSVAELRGKIVVLHFWSSTCPWEIVAEPKINAFAAEYADRDVVVLGVAANAREIGSRPEPAAFLASGGDRPYGKLRDKVTESEIDHPILVDHDAVLGRMLDARTTPQVFVFDRHGAMAYTGALDDDGRGRDPHRAANLLRAAVDDLLAGRPVETARTRPYGGSTRFLAESP